MPSPTRDRSRSATSVSAQTQSPGGTASSAVRVGPAEDVGFCLSVLKEYSVSAVYGRGPEWEVELETEVPQPIKDAGFPVYSTSPFTGHKGNRVWKHPMKRWVERTLLREKKQVSCKSKLTWLERILFKKFIYSFLL